MSDIDDFEEENEGILIPEISPTASQAKAISDIKEWYQGYPENGQQIFRLFGYAGTGKTTLTKYAIADLGLSMFQPPKRKALIKGPIPNVYFGSFTGKASYVMRRHGTPAQTIHSMIYSVMEASEQQVIEAEIKLRSLIGEIDGKSGMDKTMAIATAEAFRSELGKMKKPVYSLDPDADVAACKLIVLDEVSMVNEEMAGHVLSYGKPVLVIGDPGQLPPVKGEGAFVAQTPDVMLEEIHRQALDSPIIRLATMARQGQTIPKGVYGDTVHKMRKEDISGTQLLRADQVICGLNATRYQLNAAMRAIAGFRQFGDLPSGMKLADVHGNPAGEKIICLKNMNSVGLINGMFIDIADPQKVDDFRFEGRITTEDGIRLPLSDIYNGFFLQHYDFDKDRDDRDWKVRRGLVESTYGWAITCHKSQGSQWKNVILYDDRWGRGEQRRKWLYTGITRAEEGLVILE